MSVQRPIRPIQNKSSWTREKYEPPGRSVLGHLLVDLKYKRLYVTCVEELLKVPVWQKSKSLRPVHAMEIANAKLAKTRVVSILPLETLGPLRWR